MAAPRQVLLELDDDDDDRSIASASSAALGIESSATSFSARRDLRAPPPPFELGPHNKLDRSAIVAPDPATETTSKFWGVNWDRQNRRWKARYSDANGKLRSIGLYNTQEAAAHAVNAAIHALPPDVQVRRNTNPVVDGQLVPKSSCKRSRAEEPAAAPTRGSARRSRQE